jgi:penicillin amidase
LSKPAVPADLLAIQLDDRALFLSRWRQLLLDVLTPDACAGRPERAEMRRFVELWGDHAAIDSVGYRAVRAFRSAVLTRFSAPITKECSKRFPEFRFWRLAYEPALWAVIQSRAANWLPSNFATWNDLFLSAADEFPEAAKKESKTLAQMTWGARNTAQIQHPFAALLPPGMRGFLNMPAQSLPGDADMPRVQSPTFGASERMVMLPGRENESIFNMPGGQSGHPLSPYYRAGHEDWVYGRPTPLLPGPTVHRMVLR